VVIHSFYSPKTATPFLPFRPPSPTATSARLPRHPPIVPLLFFFIPPSNSMYCPQANLACPVLPSRGRSFFSSSSCDSWVTPSLPWSFDPRPHFLSSPPVVILTSQFRNGIAYSFVVLVSYGPILSSHFKPFRAPARGRLPHGKTFFRPPPPFTPPSQCRNHLTPRRHPHHGRPANRRSLPLSANNPPNTEASRLLLHPPANLP